MAASSAEEATLVSQTIHWCHMAPKTQIFRLGVLRSFEHQTSVSHPSLLMHLLIQPAFCSQLNISFVPKKETNERFGASLRHLAPIPFFHTTRTFNDEKRKAALIDEFEDYTLLCQNSEPDSLSNSLCITAET